MGPLDIHQTYLVFIQRDTVTEGKFHSQTFVYPARILGCYCMP